MESRCSQLGGVMQTLFDGLFPRFCLRCGVEGTTLCLPCREAYQPGPMPPACRTSSLDGCVALGWYRDPVLRGAIRLSKYYGDPDVWEVIESWIRASSIEARFPEGPWAICPIPLHKARERERGFNQAEWIAEILSSVTGWPLARVLRRASWTDPQARKGTPQRKIGDLDGIFETTLEPFSRVLLCDDVMTSGATMDAAACELRGAGVRAVWGFTLARGSA